MSDSYTGVKVLYTSKENIDLVYKNGYIDLNIFDGRLRLNKNQNMFIVLKDEVPKEQGGVASVLCWVKGERAQKVKVDSNTSISSIHPRNKEQIFAFEALLDDSIQAVAIAGAAGTGKTLISSAAALFKTEKNIYDRIILTRPMSQVGKKEIGFLPGDLLSKYMPFNQGYICNFEHLLGKQDIETAIEQLPIEFVPIQLVRGASWPRSLIIVDESQNLGHHETLTIGTRVGEGSKIIFLGDLDQRDEKISKEATGLYKVMNSPVFKENSLTASIELLKCERGPIPEIFSKIFAD